MKKLDMLKLVCTLWQTNKYAVFTFLLLFFLKINPAVAFDENLTLINEVIKNGELKVYKAADTITAGPSFVIEDNASVVMNAGGRIVLKDGFKALQGSYSHVKNIYPEDGDAINHNGNLESGNLSGWTGYFNTTNNAKGEIKVNSDTAYNGSYALDIDIQQQGSSINDIAVYSEGASTGFTIKEGQTYKVSFAAKSDTPFNDVGISVIKNSSPWTNCNLNESFDITISWKTYQFIFVSSETIVEGATIKFSLGGKSAGHVFIDDCTIEEFLPINYHYDELNRLIRVEKAGHYTIIYDYDSAGNRMGKTTLTN